eukprot:UN08883
MYIFSERRDNPRMWNIDLTTSLQFLKNHTLEWTASWRPQKRTT